MCVCVCVCVCVWLGMTERRRGTRGLKYRLQMVTADGFRALYLYTGSGGRIVDKRKGGWGGEKKT